MFEDLNSIFLIYYEFNEKLKQNKTKKIIFNHATIPVTERLNANV